MGRGVTLLGAAEGFLSWMEEEGSLKVLGPEGVVGLGKAGGGGPFGVWGFLMASGIKSGPEGTCAPQGQSVSNSFRWSWNQCKRAHASTRQG